MQNELPSSASLGPWGLGRSRCPHPEDVSGCLVGLVRVGLQLE